jgi:hypothetical protein
VIIPATVTKLMGLPSTGLAPMVFAVTSVFHRDTKILPPGQFYLSPVAIGIAKIAPWCLARRDPSLRSGLVAKVPG